MRNKILNITSDINFELNQLGIPFTLHFETLHHIITYKPFKGLTGTYIMYDPILEVTWYIGQSCSPGPTNKGGIQARIPKHYSRSMGTSTDTPMEAWVTFERWIKMHQYSFYTNTEVAVIVVDPILFQMYCTNKSYKQVMDDVERQIILYSTLYPFVNDETFHHSRFSILAPSPNGISLPIPTLMPVIG